MTFVCKKETGSITTLWRRVFAGQTFETADSDEIVYLMGNPDFGEVKECTPQKKKSGRNSKA